MNRTLGLLALAGIAAALYFATAAEAQAPTPIPNVWLQSGSPGMGQTGNLNISGTAKVGGFQLGNSATAGHVLTADAAGVGTWQAATGLTLPYTGAINFSGTAFQVSNSTTAGTAIRGEITSTGGGSDRIGVRGHGPWDVTLFVEHTGVLGTGNWGVRGEGTSIGVFGKSAADGVYGYATAANGRGVYGYGRSLSGFGSTYGGYFDSYDGVGVYGKGYGGGVFVSSSAQATGCVGHNQSTTGGGAGIVGQSESPDGVGVWGYCIGGGGGWSIYAVGRMGCSGTKPFSIDHPLDPENKYLLHYSTESPEPQNFYSGEVRTDANGMAWVQLPEYFAEINTDFKYQLTVIDDNDSEQFVLVKVAQRIKGNNFKVRTNAPNIAVSWRVEAKRNDRWVREYGAPSEERKLENHKGKYLHPELYGLPKEMAVHNMNQPATTKPQHKR